LNDENLTLKVIDQNKSNKVDGTFEIKEVNAENSMNLEALSDHKEVDTGSKDWGVLSKVALSQKKIEIENAVSLALSITNDPDPSFGWLRPKIRPISLYRNSNITEDQIISNEPMAELPIGRAVVQLGAFDSKNLAESEWQRFEKLLGSILIPKKMVVQRAESGGKIFYRLRASGFNDISDARQFCTAISDKVACIPVVTR
jgi:hypothetical protein